MNYFANNLKHLRKIFGETQDDLAELIFTGKSTISNYENSTRFPEENVLNKIAKHYQVTLEQLLYSDLTDIPSYLDIITNIDEEAIILFNRIIPLFKLKDSLTSKEYKEAFELHMKLMRGSLAERETVNISFLIDVYVEAIGNYDKPIFLLNYLSLLFTCCIDYCSVPDIETIDSEQVKSFFKTKERSKLEVRKQLSYIGLLGHDEFGNEIVRSESTNEWDEEILLVIEKLKNTQYSDVAYYYFALRYIYNIANSGHDKAINQLIGIALFTDLIKINNKYAKRYLAIVEKLIKVHKLWTTI